MELIKKVGKQTLDKIVRTVIGLGVATSISCASTQEKPVVEIPPPQVEMGTLYGELRADALTCLLSSNTYSPKIQKIVKEHEEEGSLLVGYKIEQDQKYLFLAVDKNNNGDFDITADFPEDDIIILSEKKRDESGYQEFVDNECTHILSLGRLLKSEEERVQEKKREQVEKERIEAEVQKKKAEEKAKLKPTRKSLKALIKGTRKHRKEETHKKTYTLAEKLPTHLQRSARKQLVPFLKEGLAQLHQDKSRVKYSLSSAIKATQIAIKSMQDPQKNDINIGYELAEGKKFVFAWKDGGLKGDTKNQRLDKGERFGIWKNDTTLKEKDNYVGKESSCHSEHSQCVLVTPGSTLDNFLSTGTVLPKNMFAPEKSKKKGVLIQYKDKTQALVRDLEPAKTEAINLSKTQRISLVKRNPYPHHRVHLYHGLTENGERHLFAVYRSSSNGKSIKPKDLVRQLKPSEYGKVDPLKAEDGATYAWTLELALQQPVSSKDIAEIAKKLPELQISRAKKCRLYGLTLAHAAYNGKTPKDEKYVSAIFRQQLQDETAKCATEKSMRRTLERRIKKSAFSDHDISLKIGLVYTPTTDQRSHDLRVTSYVQWLLASDSDDQKLAIAKRCGPIDTPYKQVICPVVQDNIKDTKLRQQARSAIECE